MNDLSLELSKDIKKLEIAVKTLITTKFIGEYRSVFRGKGLEFESFREYTPEDDFRFIDWKVSARINKLMMKEYKEERNLDIIFLLDTSSNMLFGSTDKIKSQYAAELVASLSYAILQANDNVSLIAFNGNNKKIVPLGNGTKQFYKIASVLLNKSNYGSTFDLKEALRFIHSTGKKESLLIIVSDFITEDTDFQSLLKVVSRKFDVIGLMLRDPRDHELPAGFKVAIESPDTTRRMIIDTSVIKERYEEYSKKQENFIIKSFQDAHSDILSIQTDKPFIKPLISLFSWRRKKWR